MDKTVYCSFCGKSQNEVKKIIAGPEVFICDECVSLCMEIVKEEEIEAFSKRIAIFLLHVRGLIKSGIRRAKHG